MGGYGFRFILWEIGTENGRFPESDPDVNRQLNFFYSDEVNGAFLRAYVAGQLSHPFRPLAKSSDYKHVFLLLGYPPFSRPRAWR